MSEIELSVVIPAYNEENSIEKTVSDADGYLSGLGLAYEIVVVDDGSRDATLSITQGLCGRFPALRVCSYTPNMGKGYAVRTGMLAAVGRKVLFTDADGATPIQELPALLAAIDAGCGVAIGSRAARGAVRVIHQPFYREIGGKVLNFFIRMFAVRGIKDTQCGFKLFTRDAAQAIFSRCFINGFSFDIEALYLARLMGYKISELPVHWSHHGNSRVRPLRDGLRLLSDIARIRFHKYPLREVARPK
jgi:dolichyl-phosphate beta-glucosyltransferase